MKKLFFLFLTVGLSACIVDKPDYILNKNAFCENDTGISTCKDADNNMLSGLIVSYTDDGLIDAKIPVKNGLVEGTSKLYDTKNGSLRLKAHSKGGKLDGVSKYYDENGDPDRDVLYKDGVIDGLTTVYYKNGKTKEERLYEKGKLNGVQKEYHENGKIKFEGPYKNDKLDGFAKFYDDNGRVKQEILYKMGKQSPKGKLYFYYESGKLKQELEYENGSSKEFTGIAKDYYENGKLKHEGQYKDGKEEGVHNFYDKNGNIEEVQYKKSEVFDEEKECKERVRFCYNNEYIKGCRTVLSGKVTGISQKGVTLRAENAWGYYWFLYTDKKYARGDSIDGSKYFEYVGTYEYVTTDGAIDRLHAYKETDIPVCYK